MEIQLSILVCSTTSRAATFFPKIVSELHKQSEGLPVEVIALTDNKRISVGLKRNLLIALSHGKYICFVDDDDRIEPDYVRQILDAMSTEPDVIVFGAIRYVDGKVDRPVKYSLLYGRDSNTKEFYLRVPNHLMPIRKELLPPNPFPNKSFGEDAAFAVRVLPLLKSEARIDKVLYHYDFSPSTTETQKR